MKITEEMALNKECFQFCCEKSNKGIREFLFTSFFPISHFLGGTALHVELITESIYKS